MKPPIQTYKMADAKARLGSLCDQTLRGISVRIIRRGELFQLIHIKRPQLLPVTDAELRAAYDDPREIDLINRFGKESVEASRSSGAALSAKPCCDFSRLSFDSATLPPRE